MTRPRVLQVRLTDEEKQGLAAAAELAGISLSDWTRERLRGAAVQALRDADQPVPFVAQPMRSAS